MTQSIYCWLIIVSLIDEPENRRVLEVEALIISRDMDDGIFDYLHHFPQGNKAHLFRREERLPSSLLRLF
jgi:hypothetical protein